jgi:hypothetical protein
MAIGAGSRIGPYEVTALIGEGGMDKVWRAHHAALNGQNIGHLRRFLMTIPAEAAEPFYSDLELPAEA